jgi:uncharacterized protein (TIRG00374 family)
MVPEPPRSPPPVWKPLREAAGVLIVAVGVAAAINRRRDLEQAWHQMGHLRPAWLLVALVAEAASMWLFAQLQRHLLRSAGIDIRSGTILAITLAANAISLSVPGGPAWSTAYDYKELRRRGVDRTIAGWVVLVAGALSSFALFIALAAGAWIAGPSGPVASLRWLALALAMIPVLAAALVVAWHRSRATRACLSTLSAHLGRHKPFQLAQRTFHAARLVRPTSRAWIGAAALAALNWAGDAACLAAAIAAIGGRVPWSGVLVAYGLGMLASVLPFTPGGLAIVEGSLTAVLVAYGMAAGPAIAGVLLYRLVAFWIDLPIGWACYGSLALAARHAETAPPLPATPADTTWHPGAHAPA